MVTSFKGFDLIYCSESVLYDGLENWKIVEVHLRKACFGIWDLGIFRRESSVVGGR